MSKHAVEALLACRKEIPENVRLLAVSKTQSVGAIRVLYEAGQRDFGENYLQEALEKMEMLRDLKEISWHFIGHIQRNKTAQIAEHFDWVQSVDSVLIANRLNDARGKHPFPPLNVCVQINFDHDPHKSGISLEESEMLLKHIQTLPHIHLRGILILPKEETDLDATRKTFQKAKKAFDHFNQLGFSLDTLSMGMSHDMMLAVEMGSTMVRIGRRIFGERM